MNKKSTRSKFRRSRPGKEWTPALDAQGQPIISGSTEVITDGKHLVITFNFPVEGPAYQKNDLLTFPDGSTARVLYAPPAEFALEPFCYRLETAQGIDWLTQDQIIERMNK